MRRKEEWAKEGWGDHHLWSRVRQEAKVSILVAMTQEPRWKDCLDSLKAQTYQDFSCVVVIDCPLPEMWKYAQENDDVRFSFHFSPTLQGLCRVWNMGLHDHGGDFVVLMGGENPLPPGFLQTGVDALTRAPDMGYVVPSVEKISDVGMGWLFVITAACIGDVGVLDVAYGPGGIGMMWDWAMRVKSAGFKPRRLPIEVEHTMYSVQDKCADWARIERLDLLKSKWGSQVDTSKGPWDLPLIENV
jgi:cellulose synthase/poly-beta-1,6-N-acetylglucosamine synthase-like glycosyltransferase